MRVRNKVQVSQVHFLEHKKDSATLYKQPTPPPLWHRFEVGSRPTPVTSTGREDPSMHAANASKLKEIPDGHGSLSQLACRESKRKCHTSGKDSPCTRCLRLNLRCSIMAPIDTKIISSAVIGDDDSEILPSPEVCNELVDLYFDIIHDKDHSLFHRPSFITNQRQGLADMMHIYAILSLAARYGFETFSFGRHQSYEAV